MAGQGRLCPTGRRGRKRDRRMKLIRETCSQPAGSPALRRSGCLVPAWAKGARNACAHGDKQSQFRLCRQAGTWLCQTNPISLRTTSRAGRAASNKANVRHRDCFVATLLAMTGKPGGTIAPNKANPGRGDLGIDYGFGMIDDSQFRENGPASRAEQSQFRRFWPENEGRDERQGQLAGRLRQTKPIAGVAPNKANSAGV